MCSNLAQYLFLHHPKSAAVIDARTLSIAHNTSDGIRERRWLLCFVAYYYRVLNKITYSSAKSLTEHLVGDVKSSGKVAPIDLAWNGIVPPFVGFDERLVLAFSEAKLGTTSSLDIVQPVNVERDPCCSANACIAETLLCSGNNTRSVHLSAAAVARWTVASHSITMYPTIRASSAHSSR